MYMSICLLLDNLLQHLTTKGFKCEVCIVAQFKQICLKKAAIETAATATKVQDSTLESVATWIKNRNWKRIKVQFLLVKEEKIESVVWSVGLPHWQTKYISSACHDKLKYF